MIYQTIPGFNNPEEAFENSVERGEALSSFPTRFSTLLKNIARNK